MRFRVVGIHPESGEGIDLEIEAPDLAWAQRMARQRGIAVDTIDPAPPPRLENGAVRLDRRGPDGSTAVGRIIVAEQDLRQSALSAQALSPPATALEVEAPSAQTAQAGMDLRGGWRDWQVMLAAAMDRLAKGIGLGKRKRRPGG